MADTLISASLNNQCELEDLDVITGHGGCTNAARRKWPMPTSSNEERQVAHSCLDVRFLPHRAAVGPAEHDIPVSVVAHGRGHLAF
jgi:hypothetical protein